MGPPSRRSTCRSRTEVPNFRARVLDEQLQAIIAVAFETVDNTSAIGGTPKCTNRQLIWRDGHFLHSLTLSV